MEAKEIEFVKELQAMGVDYLVGILSEMNILYAQHALDRVCNGDQCISLSSSTHVYCLNQIVELLKTLTK